MQLWQYFVY